jgi:hypothetical protein
MMVRSPLNLSLSQSVNGYPGSPGSDSFVHVSQTTILHRFLDPLAKP